MTSSPVTACAVDPTALRAAHLSQLFTHIPDPRKARGKRHPLPVILALVVAAVASGAKSIYAIADYAADTGPELLTQLGHPTNIMSEATLRRVIEALNAETFSLICGAWLRIRATRTAGRQELGVSPSGYYKWRTQPVSDHDRRDELLSELIRHFHKMLAGNPGVRRIHAELVAAGHRLSRKRVHRLMQTLGLQGRHPKPWKRTTVPGEKPAPAPDLIGRDFTATSRNQKWCGDITYIKTWNGWAYLATVIDLHSRKVVGWAIDTHMRTSLVTDALEMAITHRRPPTNVIFHSDRGTQYTSHAFAQYCKDHKIRRSLGRTGICYDNAVAESFFASYKKELIHTRPWPDIKTLKKHTFTWIEIYYNQTRRHSTLGYLTPAEYELGLRHINELAA